MVLLFVLFPRIGPLWGVPSDGVARTGLSDSMQMGSLAELAIDEHRAAHPFSQRQRSAAENLYFRGPVLSRYDGREWRTAGRDRPQARAAELRPRGPALAYEMTLEPSRTTILPLLEATATALRLDGLRTVPGLALDWRTDRPIAERLRFDATAHVASTTAAGAAAGAARRTPVCPAANPRTLAYGAVARAATPGRRPPRALTAALMQQHIRSAGFVRHTLTLARTPKTAADAIDEFWLDRKQVCEHYAAAFVFIMRAMACRRAGRHRLPGRGHRSGGRLPRRAPEQRARLGRVLGGRRGWVRADPTRPSRPTDRAQPAPGAAGGSGRERDRRRQPGPAGPDAPGLGGDEQPLEPVGAELTRAASSSTCCATSARTPSWEDLTCC